MPIEALPNRLGGVPPVAQPYIAPPQQVFPTGELAQRSAEMLSHIVDSLSPLEKAKRDAALQQLSVQTELYQRAKGGDQHALDLIFGHNTNNLLENVKLQDARDRHQAAMDAHNKAIDAKNGKGVDPIIQSRIIAAQKAHMEGQGQGQVVQVNKHADPTDIFMNGPAATQ